MFVMLKKLLATNKKNILVLFVGLSIALLGYRLQAFMFSDFPPGGGGDEVKSVFNGISLLTQGVPQSWSWWDDYGKFPVQDIRGHDYRMVKPWFDEPPVFGLLIGSYAMLKGMDTYGKVDTGALRWPMIKLGALNIFLLFILVFIVSGLREATVAGLVYATVPTFVISSRMAISENLLITFSLVSLLLLILYLKKGFKWALILCAALSGLAVLVKQPGIFIPTAVILTLFSLKRMKAALWVIVFTAFFLGAWLAYGWYYNWSLFVQLQGAFSGREIRLPTMVINLFDTFRIGEKPMSADGWLIWGWVSVVVLSLLGQVRKENLSRIILLTVIGSYLIFFSVMTGHSKGWYRFPFYPFLAWAIAVGFVNNVKNPKFLYSFFFLLLAGATSFITGTGEHYWDRLEVKLYQVFIPLVMTPFVLNEFRENHVYKRVVQVTLIVFFLLAVILNIRTMLSFQDQFWY